MRTTLTIDDDLAREIKEIAARERSSVKAVVNRILRQGLSTGAKPVPERPRFVVESEPRGFMPGVDPARLNQLLDELEAEQFLADQHDCE